MSQSAMSKKLGNAEREGFGMCSEEGRMDTKRSVYAVTVGSFDDYRVLCLCGDQDTAERFSIAWNEREGYQDASVETMELWPVGSEPRVGCLFRAEAVLNDNGTVERERAWSVSELCFDQSFVVPLHVQVMYARAPVLENKAGFLRVKGASRDDVDAAMAYYKREFLEGRWSPRARQPGPGAYRVQG